MLNNNTLLHKSLNKVASHLLRIDYSRHGINIMKEKGFDNVILMDAENITLDEKYDFVLARDILEDMNHPGKFLEKVEQFLNPQGSLIIGVPNVLGDNIFLFFRSPASIEKTILER
jgi:2-polyprenyl-3-methyl-5-hydroxy-6-metoxy-1,4-benzoquinol methylase